MSSPVTFSVIRGTPQLVAPARPTPRKLKPLSDIDDQEGLKFHVPIVFFYRNCSLMVGKDPAKLIRNALGEALVYYYPFAGRLIEGCDRKLQVDCTGEGVLFIEADADTTLDHLGDAVQPPSPCFEELLYDVPGYGGILACPLLIFQVGILY